MQLAPHRNVSPDSINLSFRNLLVLKMAQLNLFSTLYTVVKEHESQKNRMCVMNGGQDWTRTSDPRLIKAVL